MPVGRYHEAIDLMKLFSQGCNETWNQYLYKLQQNKDFEGALKVRFGLQSGMDDLVKKRLNNETFDTLYASLMRSIEKNLRWIYRAKYPNPLDNTLSKHAYTANQIATLRKQKKDRDLRFEAILKERSY